jgi:heterodisulfide reductase subunit A-like polyferredoxin
MELSQHHQDFFRAVRDMAEKRVAPLANEIDRSDEDVLIVCASVAGIAATDTLRSRGHRPAITGNRCRPV